MVYLDNNSTTQVVPSVLQAMELYFIDQFANPSALHNLGSSVSEKIQDIRRLIAERIGCTAEEIIFTSSGSEANNLCLKGYLHANKSKGKHLITTGIEHASILSTSAYLEREGFKVTYLEVDNGGFVDPKALEAAITEETCLISIAHANNEIGTIQPIERLTRIRPDIAFHTDAVQSFLKMDFNVDALGVDLASFSGHKFHAPKGIGFVYKRKGCQLTPQIHGGQQEMHLRSGTENVPYIIGLGKAIEEMSESDLVYMRRLQRELIAKLKTISGVRINGPEDLSKRLCTNVNFSYEALEGEVILNELSSHGIYVSTGSACSSKYSRVSHVLQSINCPTRFIHGNIRVGISKFTTIEEVDTFIVKFKNIIAAHSPFRLVAC
jgi:cysteine desulfurase